MGVGVTLWYGCGGVVSVCRLRHYLMVEEEDGKLLAGFACSWVETSGRLV